MRSFVAAAKTSHEIVERFVFDADTSLARPTITASNQNHGTILNGIEDRRTATMNL
jgi:hypothetical protein